MKPCDCCLKEKPDAEIRPGLYPLDAQGKRASRAYLGFLCDDCLEKAKQSGSRENQWILREVGLVRPSRALDRPGRSGGD